MSEEENQSGVNTEENSSASETDQEAVVEQDGAATETKETITTNPKDDFYKNQYENLQKDYTRKAQELAALKSKPNETAQEPEWTRADWQPKTWQEATEAGKQAALKEIAPLLTEVQQAKQQRDLIAQAQEAVNKEWAEIKALDPKIDENVLFNYANKYGFNSLKSAYQSLLDRRELEKTVEARVLKNLNIRQQDAVGISASATSGTDEAPSYQELTSQKSIHSAAFEALSRLRKK